MAETTAEDPAATPILRRRVEVYFPSAADEGLIGEFREIQWRAGGGPTSLRIDLSRDGGADWENLAVQVPADAGAWPWTVTEPVTAHGLVRILDEDDPTVTDTSAEEFVIGHDLTWIEPSLWVGSAVAGEPVEVILTFDATGRALGLYAAELVVEHTAGEPIAVPITLEVSDDATPADDELPPRAANLQQNVPNPFNPRTTVVFDLPRPGRVRVEVFDLKGRLVRVLADERRPAGRHSVVWDGRDDTGAAVASGTYFCRMVGDGETFSRAMTLLK